MADTQTGKTKKAPLVLKTITPPNLSTQVKFELPADSLKKLKELKTKHKLKLKFPLGGASDVSQLKEEFEYLCLCELEGQLRNADKLALMKYKLALMKAVEKHLLEEILHRKIQEIIKKQSLLGYILRRVTFAALLVTGLTIDGIGSFLGVQEIMQLIGGISYGVSLAIGLGFCVVNSALFYSFEAGLLKKTLGIDTIDQASRHIAVEEEALECARRINKLLMKDGINQFCSREGAKTYHAFGGIAASFNNNIKHKREVLKSPKENIFQKIIRHTLTFVGAIMMGAFGFFMTKSLLLAVAPVLLTSPIGWVILGIGVISQLAYFLSMRGKGVVHLMNPAIQNFKELKTKLDTFEEKSEKDFSNHFKNKNDRGKIEISEFLKNKKPEKAPEMVKASCAKTAKDTYGQWFQPAPPKQAAAPKADPAAKPAFGLST